MVTSPFPPLKGPRCADRKHSGFTLIELIVVMVIIGIMAVVALPRLDSLSSFDALGYADQLRSVLRFAQKTALAQRRAIIVDFSGATPVLEYASASSCTASGNPMSFPATLRARGGSTPSPTVGGGLASAWLCFDTIGKPYGAGPAALANAGTVTVGDAPIISIEPETGYVR